MSAVSSRVPYFSSHASTVIQLTYRDQNRGEGAHAKAGAEGRRGVGYQRIEKGIGEGEVIIQLVLPSSYGSKSNHSI